MGTRSLVVFAAFACYLATVTATVVDDEGLVVTLETDSGDLDSLGFHSSLSRLSKRSTRRKRAYADRPGEPTLTHSCNHVRDVPDELRDKKVLAPKGAGAFYKKYTEAYGIPVLSSEKVPDSALKRACYVLRFVLADVASVRRSFYKRSGRVGVMSDKEVTKDIPEHSFLADYWNQRARGMGGTPTAPISTGATENILCWNSSLDRYSKEDILLHELSHGVHLLGANFALPDFTPRLKELYNSSKQAGRWAQTYSMTNHLEYYAEGVQSYFNDNTYSPLPNGVHNNINTRDKLRLYDPGLYNLISELFPCNNIFLLRCKSTREEENAQDLKMDCLPMKETTPKPTPAPPSCQDFNMNCLMWASQGHCQNSAAYMLRNCRRSCSFCNPVMACEDETPKCVTRARNGACKVGSVSSKCPKSCGACPSPDGFYPCRDLNYYCDAWAKGGNCGSEYMGRYCRRSCGLCWQQPYRNLLQTMLAAFQIADASVQH